MDLSIIAAVAEGRVIGVQNRMPWHIKEDFARFKKLTMDHGVIMGQNTYLSILDALGKPLPGRHSIVLSDDLKFSDQRVEIARSLKEAEHLALAHNQEAFIAGGASIYKQFMPKATKMYLTHVRGQYDGDAFFPEFSPAVWKETWREDHTKFSFVNYERTNPLN